MNEPTPKELLKIEKEALIDKLRPKETKIKDSIEKENNHPFNLFNLQEKLTNYL